jgi:hypothetical protein
VTQTYKTENEAIEAAQEQARQAGFVEFNGWNCHDVGVEHCDACRGWDGESHRCDCGNRRVCWEVQRAVDGGFYAYAEAY